MDEPDLTPARLEVLRVVAELETPDRHPGTKAVGRRLLEVWKRRSGPYHFHASAPWQGTHPYAAELRDAGLLEVHYGIAKFRRPDQPAETIEEYWLGVTDLGHQALADDASD